MFLKYNLITVNYIIIEVGRMNGPGLAAAAPLVLHKLVDAFHAGGQKLGCCKQRPCMVCTIDGG